MTVREVVQPPLVVLRASEAAQHRIVHGSREGTGHFSIIAEESTSSCGLPA